MAKLILSSCDFGNTSSAKCIYDNLPKPIDKCRVLYFPNEKATEEKIKSNIFYNRLSMFGFHRNNIQVFNYFSPSEFDALSVDVVYISGGNTFGTLKRIKDSGADKVIFEHIKKGAVYIGGSAGAHIASSNIAHVEKYDANTFGLNDLSGLNLFDGILICHYSDERRKDYEELKRKGEHRVITLTDQESIVIDN